MTRRFPLPPYPTGWFQVAYSDELPAGGVLPLRYFGQDLVLFRSELGRARVLDAYCPHLGAHLGVGGTVVGESIRCPFHHWCFDGAGACTAIPYARKLPVAASTRAWQVVEANGFILVCYPASQPPGWKVPLLEEAQSDAWTPWDRRSWRVRTHIQEMVENAFDTAHFRYLHALHNLPDAEVSFEGPHFRLRCRTVMQTPFGDIDGTLAIHSLGFGFGTVRFTGLIDTLLVSAVIPVDEEHVDVRFSFSVKKLPDEGATKMVGLGFIDELSRQTEQDIRIWETKAYLERPVLCDGDGPIMAFRRWARQFYVTEDDYCASA